VYSTLKQRKKGRSLHVKCLRLPMTMCYGFWLVNKYDPNIDFDDVDDDKCFDFQDEIYNFEQIHFYSRE